MELRHDLVERDGRDILVVTFSGVIAPGSEGNADAARGRDYIEEQLSGDHAALILDLGALDYVFGNYVPQWFLVPMKRRGIPVKLVAGGATARALRSLFEASRLEPVLGEPVLFDSVDDALAALAPPPGSER